MYKFIPSWSENTRALFDLTPLQNWLIWWHSFLKSSSSEFSCTTKWLGFFMCVTYTHSFFAESRQFAIIQPLQLQLRRKESEDTEKHCHELFCFSNHFELLRNALDMTKVGYWTILVPTRVRSLALDVENAAHQGTSSAAHTWRQTVRLARR